ncbi:zinc finger CCCH-type antiviral protein 1-like isoform X2 [Hyla sarda]|uniref:zinc finger CCCH-type antiviral protein 1-like isoform X2 n=1 Tax=Hyla sarda TaxID=327740 RepID=UPI0024C3F72D|nr:zinc finger CCCH-type antiviral protein 1-like isoform X2 [Hyla sarda]
MAHAILMTCIVPHSSLQVIGWTLGYWGALVYAQRTDTRGLCQTDLLVVCVKYLQDSCDLGEDCSWLHVCGFFTRGECRFRNCKRSHRLLEFSSDLLLTRWGIPEETIKNFEMIYTVKYHECVQAVWAENKKDQKWQPGAQRGRKGGKRGGKGGGGGGGREGERGGEREGERGGEREEGGKKGGKGKSRNRKKGYQQEREGCHDDEDDEEDDSHEDLYEMTKNWLICPPDKSKDQLDLLLKKAKTSPGHVSSPTPQPTPTAGLRAGQSSSSSTPCDLQPKPTSVRAVSPPPTSGEIQPVPPPMEGPSLADSVTPVSPTEVIPSTAPVHQPRPSTLVDCPETSPSDTPVAPAIKQGRFYRVNLMDPRLY